MGIRTETKSSGDRVWDNGLRTKKKRGKILLLGICNHVHVIFVAFFVTFKSYLNKIYGKVFLRRSIFADISLSMDVNTKHGPPFGLPFWKSKRRIVGYDKKLWYNIYLSKVCFKISETDFIHGYNFCNFRDFFSLWRLMSTSLYIRLQWKY